MTATSNPLALKFEIGGPGPDPVDLKIFDTLVAFLPGDANISPQEAAAQINSLYSTKRPGDDEDTTSGSLIFSFWDILFQIVGQIDCETVPMQRCIALIKALRDLPSDQTIVTNAETGSCLRVWQDLPYIGSELNERWRQTGAPGIGMEPQQERYHQWRNINGFIAYMTSENMYSSDYEALCCIYNALEHDKKKKQMNSLVKCDVPVAALYFNICAPAIYDACIRTWGHQSSNWAGEQWKGEKGYSLARWDFWKGRLMLLSNHPMATAEGAAAAKTAVARMKAVEEQHEN